MGKRLFRVVRTEEDARERRSGAFELGLHPVGEFSERGFVVVAAPDAGLVGDDDQREARVVKAPGGVEHPRHPFERFDRVDVGVIDVDHAVAVEKGGAAHQPSTGWA